jgi:hypothetical protein
MAKLIKSFQNFCTFVHPREFLFFFRRKKKEKVLSRRIKWILADLPQGIKKGWRNLIAVQFIIWKTLS